MRLSRFALAGAGATVAAAAAVLLRREQTRRATERFAAAALETLLNAIDANDPDTGAHVRRVAALCAHPRRRGRALRARVQEHRARRALSRYREDPRRAHRHRPRRPGAQPRRSSSHRARTPRRGASVLEPLHAVLSRSRRRRALASRALGRERIPARAQGRRIPLAARVVADRRHVRRASPTAAAIATRSPTTSRVRCC